MNANKQLIPTLILTVVGLLVLLGGGMPDHSIRILIGIAILTTAYAIRPPRTKRKEPAQ